MKDTAAWMTMPDQLKLQNGDSFQDKADRFAQAINRTQQGIRVLSQSGIAFVKTRKSYLSLLSNYHSEIHRHSDDLSFDLYEYGHRVVSDTGIPDKDFGRPTCTRSRPRRTASSSVDGQDFPRDADHAYGSGTARQRRGGRLVRARGDQPRCRSPGVDHRRLLLYKPESRWSSPTACARRPRTLPELLPDRPRVRLQQTSDGARLFAGSDDVDVFNDSTDPNLQRGAVRGQKDPLLGYVWEDFRDRTPRWVETTAATGSNVDNVTTFSVDPKKTLHVSAAGPWRTPAKLHHQRGRHGRQDLTVVRQGGQLTVQEADVPAAPVP